VPLGGSRAALRPLVKIFKKEMLLWMLDGIKGLDFDAGDDLVIVYNSSFTDGEVLEKLVRDNFDDRVRFAPLAAGTAGAAESVLQGLNALVRVRRAIDGSLASAASYLKGRPIISWDGDLVYRSDFNVVTKYRALCSKQCCGACIAFQNPGPQKGRFSYCSVGENLEIKTVNAAAKVSDWANTGTYCFPDGYQLMKKCEKRLQLQTKLDVAYVVQDLLESTTFRLIPLDPKQFHSFNTPAEAVDILCAPPSHPNSPQGAPASPIELDRNPLMTQWLCGEDDGDESSDGR